jgi:RNA polymerase sigma-70 factor (ECF subfamily)
MASTMKPERDAAIQTRSSLLRRLRSGDDAQSWEDFYRIYGGLIRSFAHKSGLTPDEAEEVVQETAIGVSRGLPNFTYDPKVCRFKSWMLNLTRWRIQNQLRKRGPGCGTAAPSPVGGTERLAAPSEDTQRTATVERIPDPAAPEFGAEWDSAWETNLITQAMEQLRPRMDDLQFQAFDLYVTKGWPAAEVATTLGISVARVYLTKHRVSALLKKELRALQRAMERHFQQQLPSRL